MLVILLAVAGVKPLDTGVPSRGDPNSLGCTTFARTHYCTTTVQQNYNFCADHCTTTVQYKLPDWLYNLPTDLCVISIYFKL